ncbi:hypothetical protein F4823DRAFT_356318, partial [Ustulina deusta]
MRMDERRLGLPCLSEQRGKRIHAREWMKDTQLIIARLVMLPFILVSLLDKSFKPLSYIADLSCASTRFSSSWMIVFFLYFWFVLSITGPRVVLGCTSNH